jgi:hypothetical protein
MVSGEKLADDGMVVERTRMCDNGHTQTTYEVVATVWASARARHAAAVEAARRRWARLHRDDAIRGALAAGIRAKAIGRKWGLTRQAVSAIGQPRVPEK